MTRDKALNKMKKAMVLYIAHDAKQSVIGSICDICNYHLADHEFYVTMCLENKARVMKYSKRLSLCNKCIESLE